MASRVQEGGGGMGSSGSFRAKIATKKAVKQLAANTAKAVATKGVKAVQSNGVKVIKPGTKKLTSKKAAKK
jgi:hypothetical protein